jgi:hypothetical protein
VDAICSPHRTNTHGIDYVEGVAHIKAPKSLVVSDIMIASIQQIKTDTRRCFKSPKYKLIILSANSFASWAFGIYVRMCLPIISHICLMAQATLPIT